VELIYIAALKSMQSLDFQEIVIAPLRYFMVKKAFIFGGRSIFKGKTKIERTRYIST
jgi:hypothetical protein